MSDIKEFTCILELMYEWSLNGKQTSHSGSFAVIYRDCCVKVAIESLLLAIAVKLLLCLS